MRAVWLQLATVALVAALILTDLGQVSAQHEAAPASAPRPQRKVARLARRTLVTPAASPGAAPALSSGPAPGSPEAPVAARPIARGSRSAAGSSMDRWMNVVKNHVQSEFSADDWPRTAVRVDIPVHGRDGGSSSSVPVLVLPIPIPISGQDCSANRGRLEKYEFKEDSSDSYASNRGSRPQAPRQQYEDRRPAYEEPRRPPPEEYRPRRPEPGPVDEDPEFSRQPQRQPAVNLFVPQPHSYEDPSIAVPPQMNKVSSAGLLEAFRTQKPQAPEQPPVLVRSRRLSPPPPPPPAPRSPPSPPPQQPPTPIFDRPLLIRGSLTVPRADYTEQYMAWWDPTTGDARLELNEGAATTVRALRAARVRRLAVIIDKTGATDVRRCTVMPERPASAEDRAPLVLPDMTQFTFHDYVLMDDTMMERWRVTAGGGGGARGETLSYRHEMILARESDNSVVPYMYSVKVDSSVLGAACDGHVHRYLEVRAARPDPALYSLDIERSCGSVEQTDDPAKVEPLREFIMMQRDPRYDSLFDKYAKDFDRKYADSTEEAIRKNLVTQTTRFVGAAGRVGASFSAGLNFLGDRLDAELAVLRGVEHDLEHFPAEAFPHQRSRLREIADELPDAFDWRERGGVSPVKYQGDCSSCWAFAVTGAVEGALFRRTRALLELSEQNLVDCSQPYGGRGCKGTWPSHAYDYIQDRGIAARKEYIPYLAKVLQCQDKRVKPVTQITAHVNVTKFSVPALKVAIRRHAPSVVIIDANLKSFQTYKSGVFYDDRCAKELPKLKHAVLAVGWGEERGEPHWVVKNSWSAAWGDGGFVRLHAPSNTCGVLALPSYPRLEPDDVLRDVEELGATPAVKPAASASPSN